MWVYVPTSCVYNIIYISLYTYNKTSCITSYVRERSTVSTRSRSRSSLLVQHYPKSHLVVVLFRQPVDFFHCFLNGTFSCAASCFFVGHCLISWFHYSFVFLRLCFVTSVLTHGITV